MIYPRAEKTWDATKLVLTICPVTKELYGYSKPVVDVEATLAAFRARYEQDWGHPIRCTSEEYAEVTRWAEDC
jgi:hypothetical protein